jgi:hypothetical protein
VRGIAISGRAGAGKSTLADALVRDHGFVRLAFADALKAEVYALTGLSKYDPGGRDELIRHGDGRRLENPDHWIEQLAERHRLATVCGFPCVIDDLRFKREASWCRDNGFVLVRIDAPLSYRRSRLAHQGLDAAFAESDGPGETELEIAPPLWDASVWNAEPGECVAAAQRLASLAATAA